MKRKQINRDKGFQFDLGHSVRSGWERKYADWLRDRNIQYFYEPKTFTLPGGLRYIPDFFLPSHLMTTFGNYKYTSSGKRIRNNSIWMDTWVEVKGYMSNKDKSKITRFKAEGNRLLVIDKKFFNSQYFR